MIAEEIRQGILTSVSEGWIAQVMGQCCCSDDGAKIKQRESRGKFRVTLEQNFSNLLSQRPAHAGHFQAVGEPGVNKVMLWKRVNLSLVLQPAKRVRENDPIVILFKCTSIGTTR